MNKILQILSAIIVSVGFIGNVANAQTCDANVDNSGNGNTTEVECEEVRNVNIVCENGVYVANFVVQGGQSGNGTVTGNQSSGSVSTGTVANYNNQEVTIGITGCGGSDTTPETPVTPGGGGNNGGNNPGNGGGIGAAAAKQPITALPFTASNDTVAIAVASIAGLAVVLALSRVAIAAYRRSNLK